jgi:hypothetical protein
VEQVLVKHRIRRVLDTSSGNTITINGKRLIETTASSGSEINADKLLANGNYDVSSGASIASVHPL